MKNRKHVWPKLSFALALVLAVVLGLAGSVAGDPGERGRGSDDRERERAEDVQDRHTDRLLEIEGVVGTGVGFMADGSPVIKVFTEREGMKGLPKELDGFDVDVQVTGKIVAQVDPKAMFDRPVPIGVSSGSERLIRYRASWYCTVGTLGARVTDGTNVYALSNNHVYAQENTGEVGDRILQPGRVDMTEQACGSLDEIDAAVIGTLHGFVPITFSWKASNTVDAAIAATTVGEVGNSTPSDGYGTPSSVPVGAELGQAVQKYGRTTGLTKGVVTAVNATVNVGYYSGTARFVDQIIIETETGTFSAGGDSGSLIVTDDGSNSPVGLLFAGSDTVTVANRIDLVLDAFGVTIDGEAGGPPPTPTPEPTPTPTPTPVPNSSLHIGDLDGSSVGSGRYWGAEVIITVDDANHNPVVNATVSGTWDAGAGGSNSCSTDTGGQCSVNRSTIPRNINQVTFTVNDVTHPTLQYDPDSNHDPDGDSQGTSITVAKP
ncbi:MAG: hypothetical protein ABID84_00320 [Chloroflexota bacterium]